MSKDAKDTATHVLVVDDEHDVLDLLCDALETCGYMVSKAESAEVAIDLARERSFDIVLCDLYLQGMNGLQLSRALANMHPHLPIVVITAHGDVDACREALSAGASDFVTKPIEFSRLPFIMENNLHRKQIEMKKLSEQRADVLFRAIKALAAAIDAKSHYTGEHSARMAEVCLAIGRKMGLSQERLNVLELAAHIHDVGKIGTPDAILSKPGRLNDDEWADILKHPATGAGFLEGIDELSEVASIIRHHHEHIDGSGYPDGLKGDAVPLLSRILSAADAYEAMTSNRPYRKALTRNEALHELLANAGTQFDPEVVNAAIAVISRMPGEYGELAA